MSDKNDKTVENGLGDLAAGLSASTMHTPTINTQLPAMVNNRYNLIFNNRALLNELYIEHGLIQTLIDVPVDEAFRKGYEIKSDQISEDDIAEAMQYIDKNDINNVIKDAMRWARLFGGAGVVAITNQDVNNPLNVNKINEFTELEFYAADLWELNMTAYTQSPIEAATLTSEHPYYFYGKKMHKSYVYPVKGKTAPSLRRPQMRGWGMTEIERFIRSFNSYLKNTNVIFECLDEAKVDVFKIEGLNNALISQQGTAATQSRLQLANQLKSYLNALVMDKNDEYDQKNMGAFAGLGDMLQQIRIGIASDLKMPLTKLFGQSASGFNAGEDDIENFNAMVEGEVREKAKHLIIHVFGLVCQKLFGFVPSDLEVEFPPLRVLSAEQEENVKNYKLDRVLRSFEIGLITAEEAQKAMNKDDLIGVTIDESGEATPISTDFGGMPREDLS